MLISQIHRFWPTIPTPVSIWPYPKTPKRKETTRRRVSGKSQNLKVPQETNQIVAEHTERLKKMMRQGEGLSETENLRNGNKRKIFEEDLGTSNEDISVNNFNRDSKNESLSIGDTDKDADQITMKDVKIDDTEVNGYVLVQFMQEATLVLHWSSCSEQPSVRRMYCQVFEK
jgi:hypothetical protein